MGLNESQPVADGHITSQPAAASSSARDESPAPAQPGRWDLDQLGCFEGIWLSKKALVIGGWVLLVLVALAVVWTGSRTTDTAHPVFSAKKENRGSEELMP